MQYIIFIVFAVVFSSFPVKALHKNQVIKLAKGSIKGSLLVSREGREFYAFMGVRYAEPPIGPLRFKPPVPIKTWTGIQTATTYGAGCLQGYNAAVLNQSEDCLFLNVYTRNLEASAPVIVFIHGGGLITGSSQQFGGPQYLMDKEIVFVTIQYRLGALGFLSTGNADAAGNYGFKDQREALRWVRDNIKMFGGDPNNVTLMGQSAGSMSVTIQIISPSSRGLFHKAIAMSGSDVSHYTPYVFQYTTDVAKNVNCPTDDTRTLVECLRKQPGLDIINAGNFIYPDENSAYPLMKWNYDFEDPNSDDPLLTKAPLQYILEGDFARIPIIIGSTRDEFFTWAWPFYDDEKLRQAVDENFAGIMPLALSYLNNPNSEAISAGLREFYLNNENLSSKNLPGLENLISDSMIGHGVHLFAKLARKFTDIYYYQNRYLGKWSKVMDENNNPIGVRHTDDLQYIFFNYGPYISPNHPDNVMVQRMLGWWTTLAKTGSPNDPKNPWTNDLPWQPSNKSVFTTFLIDKTCTNAEEPYRERFAIWDKLFGYNLL